MGGEGDIPGMFVRCAMSFKISPALCLAGSILVAPIPRAHIERWVGIWTLCYADGGLFNTDRQC